jgi:hypothetical protein
MWNAIVERIVSRREYGRGHHREEESSMLCRGCRNAFHSGLHQPPAQAVDDPRLGAHALLWRANQLCCPGCNFRSIKTRAPWALTFSVNMRSLSFGSSCRRTSTLTVLTIRFSDRPFDMVPESLRAPRQHVHRKVVPLSDGHLCELT